MMFAVNMFLTISKVVMLVGGQTFVSVNLCSDVRDIIVGARLQLVCYTRLPGTIFYILGST